MTTTAINSVNLRNINFLKGLSSASFATGSSSANSFSVSQANHGFSQGQVLYYNSASSLYMLANAVAPVSSEVLGLVSVVTDSNTFVLALAGQITGLTGLSAGTTYFLSDVTAGALQTQDITSPGHVSLPLFTATSSTSGVFYRSRGIVIVNVGATLSNFLPGRNRFINGEPMIAQRGAGGSASFVFAGVAGYALDRFQCKSATGTSMTVSQLQLSNGTWAAVVNRTAGNTGTGLIQWTQSMTRDQCRDMAGRQVTKSFKVYANANFSSANNALTLKVVSGTGLTDVSHLTTGFTNATTLYNQTITLSTTQQTVVATVNVPANATQLYYELSFSGVGTAGSADGFVVTDQQSELGGVASPFERKSFTQNLLDCLPFYEKSYLYAVSPATANALSPMASGYFNAATGTAFAFPRFVIPKINTPVIKLFSAGAASLNAVSYISGSSYADSAASSGVPTNITATGFQVFNQSGSSIGPLSSAFYQYTADCDLT